ncbi:MAG TPA: hypothetical protein VII03_02585 [Solirubrobacteraceae bacterium]
MRLRALSLRSFAVLATLAVLAATPAQGALPNAEIRGRLSGLPANPLLADVFAVDTRGVIAAGVELKPGGSFRMAVPSGSYVLIGSAAAPAGKEFLGGTPPVHARAHKRNTIGGRLRKVKAGAATTPPPLAHGAIATVGSIPVLDTSAPTELAGADLRARVINLLLNLCSGAGTVLVDTSPQFVSFAMQELALSRAHRLATPFVYKPLKPQFMISGKAEVALGPAAPPHNVGLTVELIATSVSGGGQVARGFAEIPPAATEIAAGALLATADLATERFAKAACGNSALS